MKRILLLMFLLFLLAGCVLMFPSPTPAPTVVPATLQSSPTAVATTASPSPQSCAVLATPPVRTESGLIIYGCVTYQDGSPAAGVSIYRAFASYNGEVIATTTVDGSYQSEFQPIPGDEMVSVWATLEGYQLVPSGTGPVSEQNRYYWRHYYGYEATRLDFVAQR